MTHPNATKARQFRLGEDTLAELDFLAERLGLSSRANVIRHLARRAAQAEGLPPQPGKKIEKKTHKEEDVA